jgi:hypothetical protein
MSIRKAIRRGNQAYSGPKINRTPTKEVRVLRREHSAATKFSTGKGVVK